MSTALAAVVPSDPCRGGRGDWWDGARAMLPVLVAYVPFALLVGAHVATSANPWAAWSATSTIHGGAAHIAVLDVAAQGSGWVAAAFAGLLVNVRLPAYATAMAPTWRTASASRRAVAALMLNDAPWAMTRTRDRGPQAYYLGAATTLFVVWPVLVGLGAIVGGRLDGLAVTGLLLPLSLGVVVAPQLRRRPSAAAVAAAAVAAVLSAGRPVGAALLLAGLVGVVAGSVAEAAS